MIIDEASARSWVTALPGADALAVERLEALAGQLAVENERQNLVSKASLDSLWQRHLADSAQLLLHVPRETSTWLDLGTGAGFPGIVIAILRPDCAVHMVESRTMRIEWLEGMCESLGLVNARVIGSPLEKVESAAFDVISARAFAPLPRLLKLSARFSTNGTRWLLPKGRSAQAELDELRGWLHTFHVEQSLTDSDAGIIVGTLAGRKGKTS